jgi:hypothetical protein
MKGLVKPPPFALNVALQGQQLIQHFRQPTAGGDHRSIGSGGVVVYRKGELSIARIDREWPHQVALPGNRCTGHTYVTIRLFCEGLSLCPRGHCFRRDGIDMNVFCFAERALAEHFHQARFGGEFIDPKDRPRWPRR